MDSRGREEVLRRLREVLSGPVQIEPGTVKPLSVDLVNLHCSVILLDETEIPEVRLKAAIDQVTDGIVEIPKDNSSVLVALIGNDRNTRFLLAVSEVEEVKMFGGLNGGMVKVNALLTKVNNLENKVNALISYINGHVHAGNGVPPAPTFGGGTLALTNLTELEDLKVTH